MCGRPNCSQVLCRRTFNIPPQYHLIAPLLQQRQPVPLISTTGPRYPSFYDVFAGETTSWVWATLARPVNLQQPPLAAKVRQTFAPLANLEKLPNEILYLIVEHCVEMQDLISFGLSSPHLWALVLDVIQSRYTANLASWAGQKIAFTCTYNGTLPHPFLENDGNGYLGDLSNDLFRLVSRTGAASFYLLDGFKTWKTPELAHKQELDCKKAISNFLSHRSGMGDALLKELSQASYMKYFPQDSVWYLRNLTTQQFISSDSLRSTGLSFHRVLLSKISYIVGEWFETSELQALLGTWAGHRFDIVTREVFVSERLASTDVDNWTKLDRETLHVICHLRNYALRHRGVPNLD